MPYPHKPPDNNRPFPKKEPAPGGRKINPGMNNPFWTAPGKQGGGSYGGGKGSPPVPKGAIQRRLARRNG